LKKKRKFNDQGKLLIISHPSIHRVYSHDRYCDYKNAMLNSILLKEKIDKNISNQAMLRLDKEFKINEHSFNKKILNTFNANDLCFGESKLDKLIEKSRLCIFTYDSTGILENLSLNIPTLAIWKNFDNHLNDEFKEKYLLLKKGKIFFEDIDKLVKHINKYWNNISSWWFSKENQSFITKFNEDFNNTGNVKSLIKLKNEIKNYE
jgi:putative transferase (TIGR04331 family)